MTTYFSALFGTTGGTVTATTTSGGGWIGTQSSATTGYTTNAIMQTQMLQSQAQVQLQMQAMYLQQSQAGALYQQADRSLTAGEYELPDGAKLVIDATGNYKVLDENAKVIYRACRVREFNPYINASDLLEAFIKEVGKIDGVDQSEILRLPIEAFINWIILQAAKRDGDPLDGLPSVESALTLPGPG